MVLVLPFCVINERQKVRVCLVESCQCHVLVSKSVINTVGLIMNTVVLIYIFIQQLINSFTTVSRLATEYRCISAGKGMS